MLLAYRLSSDRARHSKLEVRSSDQPCARTAAKCILLMTCIFRGYKRNCGIINNVSGRIVFLRRVGRNHDQLIS